MPTTKHDLAKLKKLGSSAEPSRTLEIFPNHTGKSLSVTLRCAEFTCRCPMTGQPDYATIDITYIPNKSVVESKSLKLYLETFRDVGVFHEHLAKDIADDFMKFVKPHSVSVTVNFNTRGGIAIAATVSLPV